ncbi:MAG: hypothetical protein D6796_08000, partial [Caldilineae bacterium]
TIVLKSRDKLFIKILETLVFIMAFGINSPENKKTVPLFVILFTYQQAKTAPQIFLNKPSTKKTEVINRLLLLYFLGQHFNF